MNLSTFVSVSDVIIFCDKYFTENQTVQETSSENFFMELKNLLNTLYYLLNLILHFKKNRNIMRVFLNEIS